VRKSPPRGSAKQPTRKQAPKQQSSPRPDPLPPFRLGVVPGATPGKWIRPWRLQRPHQPIELVEIAFADQAAAIRDRLVDVAICRRPIGGDDLHVISLYDEVPVVVMGAESDLTVAEELTPADLAGEVLMTPTDDVLGPLGLPTEAPRFPAMSTEDTIRTVATGIGIVVVPMSLARLHHRKDVEYRPLADVPGSPVVLAWLRERDAEDVQAFVGITRGRTARSSR
jgi:DNA-binding transcriptional LysR family regulator